MGGLGISPNSVSPNNLSSNPVSPNEDRFNQYAEFAEKQLRQGAGKAIVRITSDHKVTQCTDGDYVGRFWRGDDRELCNNDVRDDFLASVLARCGKQRVADLPSGVKKALELGKFALGKSGKASSGKPLTARRIMAVREAIRDYELKGAKDPLSELPMRQSDDSQLCYVNSMINAMKRTPAGRRYLQSIFTPKGCTLFCKQGDGFVPKSYKYSQVHVDRIQFVNKEIDCRRFSRLEQAMLQHKFIQEGNACQSGGTAVLGANMLGLMSNKFPPLSQSSRTEPGAKKITPEEEIYTLIKAHLKAGDLVIDDPSQHVRAIIGVEREQRGVDDKQQPVYNYRIQYLDDSTVDQIYWEDFNILHTIDTKRYQFVTIPQQFQS